MLEVVRACESFNPNSRSHVTGFCRNFLGQKTHTHKLQNAYPPDLIPGLTDDIAKHCLALVPRKHLQSMGSVCKLWRSFIQSNEFYVIRKFAGMLEEWLYILTIDEGSSKSQWYVSKPAHGKWQPLPPMPGPEKRGFGHVVVGHKLFVMGGLFVDEDGVVTASDCLYEYDSSLNRWKEISSMKVARYDFACSEIGGLVYVVGGHGSQGEELSSVEQFDPQRNEWTVIESLRRPRWGCFACSLQGKLYVMGGRSSFTLGNSKVIEIYHPESHNWTQVRNGCVMVLAHAILGNKLMCVEWKNERKLAIFNPVDNSWERVPMPLNGNLTVSFCFGTLNGKLLIFSNQREDAYKTLVYDPSALNDSNWQTLDLKTQGSCVCSVSIVA